MGEPHLYQKIAQSIRQKILVGTLKPGDRLPSIREMADQWSCTIGTAQRAYRDLANQGLITMRSGRGTKVVDNLELQGETPLRRAALLHRAEAFLLEVLTTGYSLPEVEQAVRQAMDRWRVVERERPKIDDNTIRFVGSHDLVMAWLAANFPEIVSGWTLQLRFTGSLGGLIALAEGKADFAGSHLWDEESDTYNIPFVRRLLPGRRIALVTLAHRRLGLILPEGNPLNVRSLEDLMLSELRFVNRQSGSGTRVWLDAALRKLGILSSEIRGYSNEKMTHSAVALAVAEGDADVGIGLQAAAISYGLDFLPLARERYDLVFLEALMDTGPIHHVVDWLRKKRTHEMIQNLGGYDTSDTSRIQWVE